MIKVIGSRLLIKPIENEQKQTKSGVIIPDSVNREEELVRGEVIQEKGAYKKGDIVYYSKYTAFGIKIEDVDYHIIPAEDIMAKE